VLSGLCVQDRCILGVLRVFRAFRDLRG